METLIDFIYTSISNGIVSLSLDLLTRITHIVFNKEYALVSKAGCTMAPVTLQLGYGHVLYKIRHDGSYEYLESISPSEYTEIIFAIEDNFKDTIDNLTNNLLNL